MERIFKPGKLKSSFRQTPKSATDLAMNLPSAHRVYLRAALFVLLGALARFSPAEPSPPSAPVKIEGTLRDASGSPVPGASILLEVNGSSAREEVKTGAAGKFTLSAPRAGTYRLRVEKEGFDPLVESVTVPFERGQAWDLVLRRSGEEKSAPALEFSDGPDFTVAGVTDWSAAGGHGSDTGLRASESLARELTSRGSPSVLPPLPSREELLRRRDELEARLKRTDNPDLNRELGDIEEQLNDPLAAEREYERAAQREPSEANYFAWATELLLHRAIQPAREVFTRGIRAHPGSERLRVGLGAALYASGLYSRASDEVCAASDLSPGDRTPYLFLGKMLEASPELLSCPIEKLARFFAERPEDGAANYYYALALSKSADDANGAPERVRALLEKSVRLDPNFAEAYLQLGIFHALRGEDQAAASAYEQATHANPELGEARFRLAEIYRKAGEISKARQEFAAYERIQKSEAARVESERRQIQQFVVIFKQPGQGQTSVSGKP